MEKEEMNTALVFLCTKSLMVGAIVAMVAPDGQGWGQQCAWRPSICLARPHIL